MKLLGISCSPRKGQNTDTILHAALDGAEETGAETEFFSVAGKRIPPCDGCWSCGKQGTCHIKDDMQELYEKLKTADGMIFATPVYFFDVTAQAKAIIDRTCALQPFGEPLRNKVAGIMVCAGSTGIMDAVKSIQAFLNAHRVFVVNWVGMYGPVDDKPQGMEAARNLGRKLSALRLQPRSSQRISLLITLHSGLIRSSRSVSGSASRWIRDWGAGQEITQFIRDCASRTD